MIRAAALVAVAAVLAPGTVSAEQHCQTNTFQITAELGLAFVDGGVFDVESLIDDRLLGLADCLCDASDVDVTIHVSNSTLPPNSPIPLEVWVGTDCDSSSRRAPGGGCKMLATSLTSLDFSSGRASIEALQPISVRDLVDPSGTAVDRCAQATYSNSVWFIFNPAQDPAEYCEITIPVDTRPPDPALNVSASAGVDQVTVTWEEPLPSGFQPTAFQVLCAAADGAPLSTNNFADFTPYDACLADGTIERPHLTTKAGPTDGKGVPPGGGGTDAPAMFANLRHAYTCTKIVLPSDGAAIIDGLPAGQPILFTVVGADLFGNASASKVVSATPMPSTSLLHPGCGCAVGERARDRASIALAFALLVLALSRRAIITPWRGSRRG
jgi:MYXO-CTERM domain-containing protein